MVDEVLISTSQTGENDPVHVSLFRAELNINPFRAGVSAFVDDGYRCPVEVALSAIYESVSR